MPSFTVLAQVNTPADQVAGSHTFTKEEFIMQEVALAASATPVVSSFAADPAKISALIMLSDVACTVTAKDADAVSIGNAQTLVANKEWIWHAEQNPGVDMLDIWTSVIASFSIVNTSSPLAAGTLKIRALVDPT